MGCRKSALALTAVLLSYAGIVAADDASMSKDLGATIALQGMPCDKVVASNRNGDSDYNATCKDGNRYRVFVDGSGRVVVKKL
jgi:hypothetical protein